ncbi:MAG: DnaJ domain-containing protein [Campylobacterota bacterium]|nr:DnaJ domain-containing protein [Campylobacterota bacterium]
MAHKKLLKEYHPDNVYNKGELYIQEYTDKFKSIQNAYDLISA